MINRIILSYASGMLRSLDNERKNPVPFQETIFREFLSKGAETIFGKDHSIKDIRNIEDFRKMVPISEYNDLQPYIDRILKGERNILWPGKVRWMAQSSGTSSTKSKFIPITDENLQKCHYSGMKRMLFTYVRNNPDSRIFCGKALTLGGSVKPGGLAGSGIMTGDLSAIMLKNSPSVAEIARSPKRSTAIIADFEEKIARISEECSRQRITSISGVPSWNLIMLKKIMEYNNVSSVTEVWPHLELFMHGGTNMDPYISEYRRIIPSDDMHYVENYNASEGYFAFQDDPDDRSMLLCCNNSVFYEFIPMGRLDAVLAGDFTHTETIDTVKTDVPYAMLITTNSGLWRYLIGDTVVFKSLYPHKIRITGRTKLFINTFGEELMISNAEEALREACEKTGAVVNEFTAGPIYIEGEHRGGHEWLVEFTKKPEDTEVFADILDKAICSRNSDYEAKRKTLVMDRLRLRTMPEGTFMKWMESRGKVGGQNKLPRLSNDRDIIESVLKVISQD